MLVYGEGIQRRSVKRIAGETHRRGKSSELSSIEAAQEYRHQKGGDLSVGDQRLLGRALYDSADKSTDLLVGQGEVVALMKDYINGVDRAYAHGFETVHTEV